MRDSRLDPRAEALVSQFTTVHTAIAQATSDLRDGADRLRSDRASIDSRVTGFVGSGWTGVAAASFTEAWDDWKSAAVDVLDGLEAMAELLQAARVEYERSDEASQDALDRVATDIVSRMG